MKTLILGMMLLAIPALAQEGPKSASQPPTTITAPAPAPAPPTKDPNDWKRPLRDIKFREF